MKEEDKELYIASLGMKLKPNSIGSYTLSLYSSSENKSRLPVLVLTFVPSLNTIVKL